MTNKIDRLLTDVVSGIWHGGARLVYDAWDWAWAPERFWKQDWLWGYSQVTLSIIEISVLIASVWFVYGQLEQQYQQMLDQRQQLSLQVVSQQVSTLDALDNQWSSPQLLRARMLVCQARKNSQDIPSAAGELIAEFFEKIAIYRGNGALPTDYVWDTYGWYITHYYQILSPVIEDARSKFEDDSLYSDFSLLYDDMLQLDRTVDPQASLSENNVNDFAEREIVIVQFSMDALGASDPLDRGTPQP